MGSTGSAPVHWSQTGSWWVGLRPKQEVMAVTYRWHELGVIVCLYECTFVPKQTLNRRLGNAVQYDGVTVQEMMQDLGRGFLFLNSSGFACVQTHVCSLVYNGHGLKAIVRPANIWCLPLCFSVNLYYKHSIKDSENTPSGGARASEGEKCATVELSEKYISLSVEMFCIKWSLNDSIIYLKHSIRVTHNAFHSYCHCSLMG